MRSIRFVASALALWFVLVNRIHAQQAEPDVRGYPPFVMLVVDTSGSMEDLPACECPATGGCSKCAPNCGAPNVAGEPPKDAAGHELKKNRWAVTLEALTGKFNDFECTTIDRDGTAGTTYDNPSSVPYHQPWKCASGTRCDYPGTTSQQNNGILDSYRDSLRFGLMTFDGEYTWRGSSDLVNAAMFSTYETTNRGMPGMWSLGPNKEYRYPGCGEVYLVNSGARSEAATEGALVSIESNNCASPPCDMYDLNATIQNMLLKTRPYGGTPIAASLEDLYYHLKDDVVDPYKACRPRYAILITDGAPDDDFRENLHCDCGELGKIGCSVGSPDDFSCPYPLSEEVAKLLVDDSDKSKPPLVKQLFVLGMSVSDLEAVKTLDKIADAGKTTKALQADDPNTLRATLDNVFSPLLNPVSRSVPGFATGLGGTQYQISTGFQVSASPLSSQAPPWIGVIERRSFVCDSSGKMSSPDIENKDKFANVINAQPKRTLYTALPSSPTVDNVQGDLIRGDQSQQLCGKEYCSMVNIGNESLVPPALFKVTTTAARTAVIDWMEGAAGSPRAGRRVGDIYHASPALVGPPLHESGDDAYQRFREDAEVKKRPLVMYVPSNDGILHAISVEDFPLTGTPSFTAGEELWGFVPPMLLPLLKDQLSSHQYYFDGTPVIKDVYYQRGTSAQDTDYHTVLITGMRGGGNAYIALDITKPSEPKFLWQFRDSDHVGDMGLTYAQPEIVQATFKWPLVNGTIQTRAVAILAGGKGKPRSFGSTSLPGCQSDLTTPTMRKSSKVYDSWYRDTAGANTVPHRTAVQCWERTGRALYFVDVETGQLIKKVFDNDNDSANGIFFPSPIVGTPTAYQNAIGTIATKGFVMDADGVIWRIDMSSTDVLPDDPSKGWTLRPFHDVFYDKDIKAEDETSYERPILSVDDQRRLVVIVGTGDPDNFQKPRADNRVVSLTEVAALESPADPNDYQALINWELRNEGRTGKGLWPSEMVTGSMALFQGQLFLATFVSGVDTSNACEEGRGRMWSLDYTLPDEKHIIPALPAGPGMPGGVPAPLTRGPTLIPVQARSEDAGGDASLYNTTVADAEPNLLIQGVGTTQRMTCTTEDRSLNSYFAESMANIQQTDAPAIWVVAQASQGAKRAGSQLGTVQTKITPPVVFSRVTSWATSID